MEINMFATYGEKVAIIVGPNGSGKSNFLKKLALDFRHERSVIAVCNTPYDRFNGVQHINRMSVSRMGTSPKSVIKEAIAETLDKDDSRLYQIGSILQYCGYLPRLGFRIARKKVKAFGTFVKEKQIDAKVIERSLEFLNRVAPGETIWIDPSESALRFSLSRDFQTVLQNEKMLREAGYIGNIQVYLQREEGQIIELFHASSGELALISSLVYLMSSLDHGPLVLIDEPENSLHPKWQREYVDKILTAMSYRDATIIIASHAPLVVTGALAKFGELVTVFQICDGDLRPLRLRQKMGGGIEEILWRAFDVITPANHFASEEIVDTISQLERGDIEKKDALNFINEMHSESFDEQQRSFFKAVSALVQTVGANGEGGGSAHD